jgi:short subunit dehydrogenase-like uncharacterized protein
MMTVRPLQWIVGVIVAALCVASAAAGTVRLDDSGSYALQPSMQMQWRSALPKSGTTPSTEAQVRVHIHIDTRAYAGRQGRIYMVLALDGDTPLTAEWQTQGRLLPGRITSGERTLVFTGPIPGAALEDELVVRLRSDRDWSSNTRRLNFTFEMDTP